MRPSQRPPDQVTAARMSRAWTLRARGWSQCAIAEELGITQSAVSKLLARIERRELKRLAAAVERQKVTQHFHLEHVASEAFQAWDRSKTPRKRAASRRSIDGGGGGGDGQGGDEVQTTEVIERDGDPSYLYAAMQALGNLRSLWGLDVLAAQQDAASTIAAITRDMAERAESYERDEATQGGAGDPGRTDGPDAGGAPQVPDGPGPVQRDDPVPGAVLE